mmetsp:Transcript_18352/g.42130  ORF Transcript_18352/g.42130 Transcript_18352/m.42130 type:complete len:343 (+) Transcript_18352:195-1223(+)
MSLRSQLFRLLPAACRTSSTRNFRSPDSKIPSALSLASRTVGFSTARRCSSLVSWRVEQDDNHKTIGIITLKSPESYNALTVEMGREFQSLVSRLEAELTDAESNADTKNIGAIVLCGEGDKAFSAGGDLRWLHSLSENSVHANVDAMLRFYKSFLCVRDQIPVPVIGALHGPAVGAGACLALACDLRVAASGDRPILGFPFSRLGIPTGMGALHLLQTVGKLSSAEAAEILLLGRTLTGEEARDLGLVNRLVSRDTVKDEAKKLAFEIARTAHPVAVRSMVRSLRLGTDGGGGGGGGGGLGDCLYKDAHAQAMCYNRRDWGEGLRAAKTRTDPVFEDYHSK